MSRGQGYGQCAGRSPAIPGRVGTSGRAVGQAKSGNVERRLRFGWFTCRFQRGLRKLQIRTPQGFASGWGCETEFCLHLWTFCGAFLPTKPQRLSCGGVRHLRRLRGLKNFRGVSDPSAQEVVPYGPPEPLNWGTLRGPACLLFAPVWSKNFDEHQIEATTGVLVSSPTTTLPTPISFAPITRTGHSNWNKITSLQKFRGSTITSPISAFAKRYSRYRWVALGKRANRKTRTAAGSLLGQDNRLIHRVAAAITCDGRIVHHY